MPDWPFISTPRLRLRPATMHDLPAIQKALADPRFPSELPLSRMLRESALAPWLQRMTTADPGPMLWAVAVPDSGTCIGTVALVEDKTPEVWWLSYWLSPAEWHKGLAREAVGALLAAASRHSSCKHVMAGVARSNAPSIRLLEQLEFCRLAVNPSTQPIPEDHITLHRWLRDSRSDA